MGEFNNDIFEGAVEITAAVMEEAEIEINAEGGERAAEFCTAVYKRLAALKDEPEEPARCGAFELYQDGKGEYRFRLKAANGEIIAVSEGYQKKESCLKGIESVKRNAAGAAVREL